MTHLRSHAGGPSRHRAVWLGIVLVAGSTRIPQCSAADPPKSGSRPRWLQATAFAIPKETAPEGEGYFSIVEGHNHRLYIGTHANGRQLMARRVRPRQPADEGGGRCAQGDRHRPEGLRLPGQDPHPQQRRQERPDLLRHQAGLSGGGREARGLSGRLSHGLRPGNRPDSRLPHPRAPRGDQQHHARRGHGRGLSLDLLRPSSRPAGERPFPGARPGQGDVQRPDRHASHLRLHRRRSPASGAAPHARGRHPPVRPQVRSSGTAQANHRRGAAEARVAPGRSGGASDQLGHHPGWQDAVCPAHEHQSALRLRPDPAGGHAGGPQPGHPHPRSQGDGLPGHVRRAHGHGLGRR